MEPYVNIGTPKACLFVFMSIKLLKKLHEHPLLYYAIEEALISAKNKYYTIGIIIWYELLKSILNANSKQDSDKRNSATHDIFKIRPTKKDYDDLLDKFKKETKKSYLKELTKEEDKEIYNEKIMNEWNKFMKELSNIA